jgi:uncharacterized protein involved in exopolysaccharide biosynthesis
MTEETKNKTQVDDDEIDLIALAKTLWDARNTIIKTIIFFMILGVLVALFSSKEYSASSTVVPQISSKNSRMGGLSSLAAIAGFNLDMNMETSELSPYIYPQIVQSVPFQLEIMNTKYTFSDVEQQVSLFEYYTEYYKPGFLSSIKKYTLGLPFILLKAIKGKTDEIPADINGNTIQLTEDQDKIRKLIEGNVTLETNDKEGYLVLTSRFHEAKLAAQVAQKSQELLQKYITDFKIEKAAEQLKFIEGRFKEKKNDFENAQATLAAFRDRNKNVTSAMARTEEERLQNEYTIAFEVYKQLAQQLEQARIKVKEDTPVFAVVKPVSVPIEKSKPKRAIILVIWTFLGGIVGVGWVFGKKFLTSVKAKWNEEPL